MVAAPEEVKEFVRQRHRGRADSSGAETTQALISAPTRARAHHVLVFGRKFYLEDTVKVIPNYWNSGILLLFTVISFDRECYNCVYDG